MAENFVMSGLAVGGTRLWVLFALPQLLAAQELVLIIIIFKLGNLTF